MVKGRRLLLLLGYAALGPVSGPCAAGIVRNFRTDPVLAGLYAFLLVAFWIELPMLVAVLAKAVLA